MSTAPLPRRKSRAACPLCRTPAVAEYAPFCSRGCKDRDLLNWLGDAYRVPGPPAMDDMEESAQSGLDIER